MKDGQPRKRRNIDQEIRINELKHEAAELAGANIDDWEADECPPDIAEAFWRQVVDYEKAPWTSHFKQLLDGGVELPAPEKLTDRELTAKLWEIIHWLAGIRVFLNATNHLSDRELYTSLWTETLHEEVVDMPFDPNGAWHIDMLGSGSEEHIFLQMKHYADEDARRHWMKQFPDYVMPAHEAPRYDRDRLLPKAHP